MKPIEIKVTYNDIGTLSDRTVRDVLKSISKICRRTQVRELDEVLRFLKLDRREIQSLKDKLESDIQTAPVYYLEYIKEGSLAAKLYFGAFMLWCLENTAGETIKDAWKETEFHKGVIEWVKERREDKIAEIISEEAKKHDVLSGRAYIEKVIKTKKKNKIIIELIIKSDANSEITEERKIDDAMVLDFAQERLNELMEELGQ